MQRYFSDKLENDCLILNKDDLYHIKTVMRLKNTDKMEVVYNNELYITSLFENKAKIISKQVTSTTNKKIRLCIPLLQDSKMSFILQKSTELGVTEIIIVNMNRSKVKDIDIKKKYLRWSKIVKEASEQSKRTTIPIINGIMNLNDLNFNGTLLMCSTSTTNTNMKKYITEDVTLIIGPEGGITKEEEQILIAKNFIPISLGNNILRVETVPIVMLGIINYEMMER